MKRILNLIIGLLLFIPFLNINALSCYESVIDVERISNFPCSEINGETLTFKNEKTKEDLSSFFQYDSSNSNISIIDKSIKFDTNIEVGKVIVSDGTSETIIQIKNHAYVKPTTTTTTNDVNTKTLTVTLDPNDGTNSTTKTCDITNDNKTCSITLPKINKKTFNGWGTAKTCKEGNSGTIKVEKNITYYACYKDNENDSNINEPNSKELLLKTLTLTDKKTEEKIEFGIFSIKNKEYSFKVLNDIENIVVNAEAEEGIAVEISGNENLTVGENKIIIKLTDDNNNQSEYTLNVTRLDEGETINRVRYLKSLVIGAYQINFNKDTFVYNLTIPSDINKLEILPPIPENEEDNVEIKNNENLIDGSQILINVISKEGQTTTYTISITKESNINYILIGAIGLIVVLIIILIILIIIKSQKKKKSNFKNNKKDNIEVLNI